MKRLIVIGNGMAGARVVEEIVSESARALQQYSDGSGLAFELSTNLATARG